MAGRPHFVYTDPINRLNRTGGTPVTPEDVQLGLGAYQSEVTFHDIELRVVDGATGAGAGTGAKTTAANPTVPNRMRTSEPATPKATGTVASNTDSSNDQRVLLVIANRHFFYREYADPKEELERAGFTVEVAAGQTGDCYPHSGSGQSGSGVVRPDLTLAQADAKRYRAIVFSGGWGSSMYQFAFPGRYNESSYNGDQATKATVNRLINDFAEQDKYIVGICNATSVLAWSRVNGRSLLSGKTVTAPTRSAPSGIYNGRPGSPSIRWHIRQNQGRLVPAGSIGNPNSAADDVVVDGKIITAEDDQSAREAGRRLAGLLKSGS